MSNILQLPITGALQTKVFETYDRSSIAQIMVVKLRTDDPESKWVLDQASAAGWGYRFMVMDLQNGKAFRDPYAWLGVFNERMCKFHRFIEDHFDRLPTVGCLDFEVIFGEKPVSQAKQSRNPHGTVSTDYSFLEEINKIER